MELAGRVIVITGAASGIGRAMALRFAKEAPAHLVCVDIDGPGAAATAAEVAASTGWSAALIVAISSASAPASTNRRPFRAFSTSSR